MEILRTCFVCRKKGDKRDFLRIVKNKDGEVFVDKTGKANGRGAYICKSSECLNKLKKTKGLNRTFKTEIKAEVYDKVEEEILGNK